MTVNENEDSENWKGNGQVDNWKTTRGNSGSVALASVKRRVMKEERRKDKTIDCRDTVRYSTQMNRSESRADVRRGTINRNSKSISPDNITCKVR